MPESPAPPADTRSPALDLGLRVEQVRGPYRLTPLPTAGGIVFALLLGLVVSPIVGPVAAWTWALAMTGVSLARIVECRAFEADPDPGPRIELWARRYFFWMVVYGAVWGSIGVLFVPSGQPLLDGVLLATVAGVAAVGVFTLVGVLPWAVVFLSLVLLPSALHHVTQGTEGSRLAWIGLLVYWLLMILETHRGGQVLRELQRVRLHNDWFSRELQSALSQAEQSSAAKSRFLATVSHEVRTPLNGILGMTQLLQRGALAPAQQRPLELVAASARHLSRLMDDVLDFTRIESGRLSLHDQPFDLMATLREAIDTHQHAAQAKGIQPVLTVPPGLPTHWQGDADRVRQVLNSLLDNAIKFTPQGAVDVTVLRLATGLRFQVSDSGPGIDAVEVERLFEPFELADASASRRVGGVGLGLALGRQLARAMGGEVRCARSGAAGSMFEFDLATRPVDPPQKPQPAASTATPATRTARVLVVEDNQVNALVALESLARFGYQAEHVEGGEAALQRLANEAFDLVLMDCQMRGIDGYETTRRWRQTEAEQGRRALPVVAVTANAASGDRERCLAAGMDDYVAKPYELDDLRVVVERQLAATARSR